MSDIAGGGSHQLQMSSPTTMNRLRGCKWARVPDIYSNKISIFEDSSYPILSKSSIDISELRENEITNSNLHPALRSLSDHPHLIFRLFKDSKISEIGRY